MLESLLFPKRSTHLHHLNKSSLALHLQDISVRFGKLWALKNIDLSIEKGDFLFLTGASGGGKDDVA